MGFIVLLAFIAVPLIEIGLFIQVGGAIGPWPTILVVVLTAMAGTALLRHQGLGALARVQDSLNRGEAPLEPVFDGFCLLAAGALLLTPGFFTDAVGFALFVPPVRALLRGLLARRVAIHAHTHSHGQSGAHFGGGFPGGRPGAGPPGGHPGGRMGDVIDGEFEDVTDRQPGASDDPRAHAQRLPNRDRQKRD